MLSSFLFLPPLFPDGSKVSQTPESTVWGSVRAAGAPNEKDGEGGRGTTRGKSVSGSA